jgi:hypothetical protein
VVGDAAARAEVGKVSDRMSDLHGHNAYLHELQALQQIVREASASVMDLSRVIDALSRTDDKNARYEQSRIVINAAVTLSNRLSAALEA